MENSIYSSGIDFSDIFINIVSGKTVHRMTVNDPDKTMTIYSGGVANSTTIKTPNELRMAALAPLL